GEVGDRRGDHADGDHLHAVRADAARECVGQACAGEAMIAAQHDALRAGVLLSEVRAESAAELFGELRSQLRLDQPANVVLTKNMQRQFHGPRNLRAASLADKRAHSVMLERAPPSTRRRPDAESRWAV